MISLHGPGPLDAFSQMEDVPLTELLIDLVNSFIEFVAPGRFSIINDGQSHVFIRLPACLPACLPDTSRQWQSMCY